MLILMQNAPPEIDLKEVLAALRQISGVEDVHHPHAWTLTSGRYLFSAHLRLEPGASVERQAEILEEAQSLLSSRFRFYFATLQFESVERDESDAVGLDLFRTGPAGETAS
jgi:cobalt-zinc-cadmium efflux system protein